MKVFAKAGNPNIATVYLAEMEKGKFIEFVESVQPPLAKSEKWVIIVSVLYGCPVGCLICDAGGWFQGRLTKKQIFSQIDYLVTASFPDRHIQVDKFKIQFARMGEPALNPQVLEVLKELPSRYPVPGLMPCLSTIAPEGTDLFFERIRLIKQALFNKGNFQLQFSLHSTDQNTRDKIIPVKKWNFIKLAKYGEKYFQSGDRKITLNFVLAKDSHLDADILINYFDPEIFLIKLTPVNPTISSRQNKIDNAIIDECQTQEMESVQGLKERGYEVLISIGELEENKIGSNCGQYIRRFLNSNINQDRKSYSYKLMVLESISS